MSSFYQFLLEKQEKSEIPVFGFADAASWENENDFSVPSEFFPTSLFPETKTVIVIGVPVLLPIIETTPSVYYNEHYKTLNAHLDAEALKLSFFLNAQNLFAVPISRDGYAGMETILKNPTAAFSHKHAAYHAGLGTFGRTNTLLTPDYGPRIRFTSIFTSASADELGVPEEVLEKRQKIKKENICINCTACARFCPAGAISSNKSESYPAEKMDKMKCINHTLTLAAKGTAPCGICIKVCPVGADRKHFNRKNIGIYNENKAETPENELKNEKLIRSWAHIRKYGTK
ncbi:4Fe-4S dicluster domain-containing protein [Methanimicrococcus sp. OttesenSCG-928-J09]|nr:4Fe-4S dicluster domain-containing protein [Methanimicrococcus sp. OttesenSCG-928-J09]